MKLSYTKKLTLNVGYTHKLYMVHAVVEAKQWGNSIGLIIPKDVAGGLELKPGEKVDIDIIKKERVDFFGIARGKGLKKFARDHDDHEF